MRRLIVFRLLALLALILSRPLGAQTSATGRIVGRVVDATTGAGIADAGVQIVGTTLGTRSGVDGRFTIPAVPSGTVTLQVRRLGFASKSVTGLVLEAGKTLDQSIALATSSVQLTAQVVTASKERGTVNEALDGQRSAVGVTNSVTAEQIAKSPDGDAAQAVKRVSGVTVQDGKYVFVRGLGERYTTSSLNGARVPSPEPEKRVVPLDMFPAGLLQTITTSKTFTPDQQGDFSGASVDIKTKEFPASRTGTLQIGSGYATGATGASLFAAPIARLNPSLTLPRLPITVIHRASGSGTGRAFSEYLATSRQWLPDAAEGDVRWPVGIAAEGNESAAADVQVTVGAIGFMELTYARQNRLSIAALLDNAGRPLQPGQAAPGYPVVTQTWLLFDPARTSGTKERALIGFARWALRDGAAIAAELEYEAMPRDTVAHYDSVLAALSLRRCATAISR